MTDTYRPFHLMTDEDYAAIGLRCGLEIHQQLLTDTKLFCRCPAGRYSDEYDAEILRHMRPTLSELGEYDGTALMEKKTKKNIHYRIHHGTVCTYEFDDTPPFFMNEQALEIAIEVALLLRLNMVSELHIARKQYLDGSIPTGFQRTTILGVDGWIPYKGRKIRIAQLGLEEDACREVSDVGHERVYLTDRLGMPLIEPVTYPDMRTPQETAEVAQILRRLTRSTGKMRTGYGAGRQDVNVSVEGGTRIEIKGVARISLVPHLVHSEAMRQCALLRIRDELKRRGITPDTFEHAVKDVTRVAEQARYQPVRAALDAGHRVKCVALRGFAGILSKITQENTAFAKEFSDRVRVIACLTSLPNIAHSDAASETLDGKQWQKLTKTMETSQRDALVLVWGSEDDTHRACEEIAIRAKEATVGVPSDTRQALPDGTNGFERVLPGADRMYPDTDLPPQAIEQTTVERVHGRLSEYVWDREDRYRDMKLPEDVIEVLSISPRAKLFDRLVNELKADPTFAAVVLCQRFKALRRDGLPVDDLIDEEIYHVFKAHTEGQLAREGVVKVLRFMLRQGPSEEPADRRVAGVLDELRLTPLSGDELASLIAEVRERTGDAAFSGPGTKHRYIMGELMSDLLGRVDGKLVSELLSRHTTGSTTS